MAITFKTQYPDEAYVLDMPTGDVLEAVGVLSAKQVAESGQTQAMMIAIRSKIEAGDLTQEAAIAELGEFKGIDFMTLTKKSAEERTAILSRLGVSDQDVEAAVSVVNQARETRSSVNQGNDIFVPQMGQIHTALYRGKVEGFADINNGIMMTQRALELAAAGSRLQSGEYDPGKGAKRGFRIFDNDPEQLQSTVLYAQHTNSLEALLAEGTDVRADIDLDEIGQVVEQVLDEATAFFQRANQPELARLALHAKTDLVDRDGEAPAPDAEPA